MKKHLLILCLAALFLKGCLLFDSTQYLRGYVYPELKQLVGLHISEVHKRISSFESVDIGTFSNKYFIEYTPRRVLSYTQICNFNGCYNTNPKYSTWGFAYFETDKEGFITKYVEGGNTHYDHYDKRKYFKDLIILEK
ncbi:hypothetical protein [Campylobacter sp. CCUG 57310]|uniref:hypothetical protein n=1 Tax=Campylobacter sp. CCUG 57310 TaxID=2517362 RepID=UPI0015657BB2|nr:hypothetical protein [Campylobacter sp. CCUG 57310]QKF92837.1 hypothetical protein CORI_1668 [Campylobacter sp. CCUG 57310]